MALWTLKTLKIVISVIYVSARLLEFSWNFMQMYITMIWLQNTKTGTLNYLLLDLLPFGHCKQRSQSYTSALSLTWKWFQRFSWSLAKNVKQNEMTCRTSEPYVWLNYFLSNGCLNIENNSFCDILVNFTRVWRTMRVSAEKENCKSSLLAFWDMALWPLKIVISVIYSYQPYLGKD